VLTAIDLDDEALVEANEIENEVPERELPPKLEKRQSPVRSNRHMAASASVGSRRIFFAKLRMRLAVGRWLGVCGTNPSPVALRASPSHKGRGKQARCLNAYTRIGISTYSAPLESLSCTKVGEPGSASFSTATSPSIWAAISSK
jgi:hypothetical protein